VDFFDFLSFLPIDSGGPAPSRARTTEESTAQVLALGLLPTVDLCILLLAGLTSSATMALFVIPLALAALAYLGCRRIGTGVGFALGQAIGCAAVCAFVGLVAILLSGISSFLFFF
jgi:hypothetical protein